MNSKKKGNKFERKIGAWFTKWTGFKFERNRAGSGAWHSNKDSTSDLTCTDERHAHRCKISVECKIIKRLSLNIYCLVTKVVIYSNSGNKLLKMQREVIRCLFFV